ncbi:hypothetical protein ACFCX4_27280 [Kitasatospora sp. NPDC056327]|uniref:hypothetical protein n=1 Tax=Kitasatospora sp. NPDC056327 TaxID=3345785 RepID=UPI0035DA5C05
MFSRLWFGQWWPMLLLWATAVASLLHLARCALLELRDKRLTGLDLTQGICVYLDESAITDQFQMGRHAAALTQEVQHRITRGGSAQVDVPGLPAGFGVERAEEMITHYVQTRTPVEVIGVLLKIIERDHGIIRANLKNGTVRRSPALVKLLGELGRADPMPRSTQLSHAEDYVLVKGRFRLAARTSDTPSGFTVFLAPYGGTAAPGTPGTDAPGASGTSGTGLTGAAGTSGGPAAHVRLVCANPGLRKNWPTGEFSGSCLGKIRGWNGEDGALDVHPVAIFQ